MRLLWYVRPFTERYFRYVAERVFPDAERTYVSDYRRLGSVDLLDRFYGILKRRRGRASWPDWISPRDEAEVVARSHVLRQFPHGKARAMASAMARAIDLALDESRPDVIGAQLVDSYVLDLLSRAAAVRGIPFLTQFAVGAAGYTCLSSRGELTPFREPSDSECEAARERMLAPGFVPIYQQEWMARFGRWPAISRALWEKPKRWVLPVLARFERDPLNSQRIFSASQRIRVFSNGVFLGRHYDWDWEERFAAWTGPKLYVPLQVYPESTIDYLSTELGLIDYASVLPEVLEAIGRDGRTLALVKEHPGMIGARPPGFYEAIEDLPNVVMVPHVVPSTRLISQCDAVHVWNGTAGLEAGIRGKPVVTMGRAYYADGPAYRSVGSRREVPRIPEIVQRAIERRAEIAGSELAPLRHLLSGCIPGEMRYVGFDPDEPGFRRDADDIVKGLRAHWESWLARTRTPRARSPEPELQAAPGSEIR